MLAHSGTPATLPGSGGNQLQGAPRRSRGEVASVLLHFHRVLSQSTSVLYANRPCLLLPEEEEEV